MDGTSPRSPDGKQPLGQSLGQYLKDRRARLDPAALGYPEGRRRTPGLRREEVAQRAHISPAWYTWLEQGRGGAPSADVLDRVARALMLTDAEREHLYMLGRGHPPERHSRHAEDISPRLQRVLDALDPCPALIRNVAFDVLGWNRAATVLLSDYEKEPPEARNILRRMFLDPRSREAQHDWLSVARFIVASFRAEALQAAGDPHVQELLDELTRASPDFAAIWRESEVIGPFGGEKVLRHPVFGDLRMEFSSFGVDGRSDLTLLIFSPLSPEDKDRFRAAVEGGGPGA
ncbi:helix-turn-helix transcriptional regulator [Acidimangrovimonas sediminis]|uniref:helix-turn-helix transcriptional regulator n=1 Tax=Acidimangrovimonas sediminis TaxID=2056283 RepID=UPI000C80B17A|nr:helix-turn-helix transcriptional regulator [Acidimangrovimonas sediminis]